MPSKGQEVKILDYKFLPRSLTVAPGTTVTWVNKDIAPHTVTRRDFSEDPFDSGNMGNEAAFSHTFHTAGTYTYLCWLHQGMQGTIVVR